MKRNWKDSDMIEGLRAGDDRALEAVMEKFHGKVYNTAIGIVKNPSDAQEVVQDVFMTLYRKADTFKGNSSLFTWIYRITVNFGFMKIRSRRKEPHIPIEEAARTDADEAVLTTILPDRRSSADDLVIQREMMGKVLQFTRELPDKYRRVFMLRDIQNYSNEEVGRLLNLSVAAVKSRIHRARSYIRERFSGFQTPQLAG